MGYLLTPTALSEFYIYPHLVIPGKIDQTVQNIQAHQHLFAIGILCYLFSYVFDVIIAWALYYLLKPVSTSLSLLASWFQLVYAAVGISASLHLATVLQLMNTPNEAALLGAGPMHAQIGLLLAAFRSTWGLSLIFFAAHLVLLGYLIFKSGYIPRLIGGLLVVAGFGYVIQNVNAYLFPEPDLGYVAFALIGELVFMFWLLIRGWKIKEPAMQPFA
nr:DUF4386 domain-containing protein [Pinirhizobacter soli]